MRQLYMTISFWGWGVGEWYILHDPETFGEFIQLLFRDLAVVIIVCGKGVPVLSRHIIVLLADLLTSFYSSKTACCFLYMPVNPVRVRITDIQLKMTHSVT